MRFYQENIVSYKTRKESICVKIYVIVLFFCGIGIWFSIQRPAHNQKIYTNAALNGKIESILVENGIIKNDILKQYVKEKNIRTAAWNEFYKIIKLKSSKTAWSFEKSFRSIARSMKVGLSRMDNADGSVTYKFYLPGRNYSNITFISSKKSFKG
jgi:cell division protein YceG involved in septum cleavage